MAVAVWLSRQVARSYRLLVIEDVEKAKKLEALSHFDQWQVIAGKLAHEINNPLTPIEMMVSNLPRIYQNADPVDFQQSLEDTQTVVSEEVQKLKAMVSHFSQFAKLPEPLLIPQDMVAHLHNFVRQQQSSWPTVKLTFACDLPSLTANFDHLLFNQCLVNLINNAVQANPQLNPLPISLNLELDIDGYAVITVYNHGKAISPEQRQSLFNLYYSTNNSSENMGLGLSIVRKIMLEHDGEVGCMALNYGAGFSLCLPPINLQESTVHE
jgi:nitrogen fixation/metabolism regulation signal transduction histidine kinase